jgi:DNA-binding YbaB/EbfC family protein
MQEKEMEISDLFKMLGDPRALQERMKEAQERIGKATAVGSAGGGMVKITLNGNFEMLGVEIAPEVVDPSDTALLKDLVRAAHNDAVAKLRESLQREIQDAAGGMPLPPNLFGGGGAF